MSAVTDIFSNASSDSYTKPTQQTVYQPTGMAQSDASYQNALNQNIANAQAVQPAWQTYLSQVTNNPYQAGAQTAANTAGQNYTTIGNQALANSSALSGAANQLLQTAYNPQSALQAQQAQQSADATNAALAARGLGSSAYGAQLGQQAATQNNLSWINNLQGLQSSALSGAGTGMTTADTLGTSGANSVLSGGTVPLSIYNQGVSTLGSGLSTYGSGANQMSNQNLSNLLNYMNLGEVAEATQANLNNQYWQNMNAYTSMENAQNAALWGSIGNLFNSGISALGY